MRRRIAMLGCALGSLLAGCGSIGNLGATPGGVKDMRLARELIAQGIIPPSEAFLVEGMFSEHDLALAGAACEQPLCISGALGIAPTLSGELSSWIQLGMSSNVTPETFVRPSLTLVLTVDVSGSMGWNQSDTTPGELSRAFMQQLVPQLNANDRVAIVTYGGQTQTALSFTSGGDHERLLSVINGLREDGSTNMEAGLQLAYSLAREARGTDQTRIMLFTDVQPNVGATTASEFEQIVSAGASQGAGLTVLGVGLGMGVELFNAMSTFKGGNAFGLITQQDVSRLIGEEWPFMVSPIAHNLRLNLTAPEGFTLAESYGFPGSDGQPGAALSVASVFLSKRNGALLVRLASQPEVPLSLLQASSSLSYEALDGRVINDSLQVRYNDQPLDARSMFYEQPIVAKTVALAVLVTAMKQAATEYGNDPDAAKETMQAAFDRVSADAAAIQDPALAPEVALASAMLALIQNRAPQASNF